MGPSPGHYYSAPEVVPETGLHHAVMDRTLPEPVDHPGRYYPEVHYPEQPTPEEPHPESQPLQAPFAQEPEKDLPKANPTREDSKIRICGLPSRKFWILFGVIVLVIVGAGVGIGVGIGVSISYRSQSTESSSSTTTPTSLDVVSASGSVSSSTSHMPTTTSAQSTSVTTTELVGPSTTLLRDCPSSDESLHEVTFGNNSSMFRKYCSIALSSVDLVNVVTTTRTTLNSCISDCARYNYLKASEIASGEINKCNTVCWWNSLDTITPGACWGYETQNSSAGEFQFETSAKNKCFDSSKKSILSCDTHKGESSPTGWKYGSRYARKSTTYELSLRWGRLTHKHNEGKCSHKGGWSWYEYKIMGKRWTGWEHGKETLLPALKVCKLLAPTTFQSEYHAPKGDKFPDTYDRWTAFRITI